MTLIALQTPARKMIPAPVPKNKFRYERKFLIQDATRSEVERSIKLHPALFSEIFHERSVNNIYFDSPENGLDLLIKIDLWIGVLPIYLL